MAPLSFSSRNFFKTDVGGGGRVRGRRRRMQTDAHGSTMALQRTIRTVAALNVGYFGIEFAVALAIGSVSLFADSIDFLEDAAVNVLILIALGWSSRNRADRQST